MKKKTGGKKSDGKKKGDEQKNAERTDGKNRLKNVVKHTATKTN